MRIELQPGESVLVKYQAWASHRSTPKGDGDLWVTDRRLIFRRHLVSVPWWGPRTIEASLGDIRGAEVEALLTFGTLAVTTPSGLLVLIPYRFLPFTAPLLSAWLSRLLRRTLQSAVPKAPNEDPEV